MFKFCVEWQQCYCKNINHHCRTTIFINAKKYQPLQQDRCFKNDCDIFYRCAWMLQSHAFFWLFRKLTDTDNLIKNFNSVHQADLDFTRKIMLWLVTQRNDAGAFISTQDTVIGLQAMATYKAWVEGVVSFSWTQSIYCEDQYHALQRIFFFLQRFCIFICRLRILWNNKFNNLCSVEAFYFINTTSIVKIWILCAVTKETRT